MAVATHMQLRNSLWPGVVIVERARIDVRCRSDYYFGVESNEESRSLETQQQVRTSLISLSYDCFFYGCGFRAYTAHMQLRMGFLAPVQNPGSDPCEGFFVRVAKPPRLV